MKTPVGVLLTDLILARAHLEKAEARARRAKSRYHAVEKRLRRCRALPEGYILHGSYVFHIGADADLPVTMDRIERFDPERDADLPLSD